MAKPPPGSLARSPAFNFLDVVTMGLAGLILDVFFPRAELEVWAKQIAADGSLIYEHKGKLRALPLPPRLRVRWSVDGEKFMHRLPEDIVRGQKLRIKGRKSGGKLIDVYEIDILEPHLGE